VSKHEELKQLAKKAQAYAKNVRENHLPERDPLYEVHREFPVKSYLLEQNRIMRKTAEKSIKYDQTYFHRQYAATRVVSTIQKPQQSAFEIAKVESIKVENIKAKRSAYLQKCEENTTHRHSEAVLKAKMTREKGEIIKELDKLSQEDRIRKQIAPMPLTWNDHMKRKNTHVKSHQKHLESVFEDRFVDQSNIYGISLI
jgi:hypothetical protein